MNLLPYSRDVICAQAQKPTGKIAYLHHIKPGQLSAITIQLLRNGCSLKPQAICLGYAIDRSLELAVTIAPSLLSDRTFGLRGSGIIETRDDIGNSAAGSPFSFGVAEQVSSCPIARGAIRNTIFAARGATSGQNYCSN